MGNGMKGYIFWDFKSPYGAPMGQPVASDLIQKGEALIDELGGENT